ncbi:PepSY domain-containing protein [Shewanella sp. C32]|uniref:PepSY domain-containing protein n=1 Tax=Shewanella electrica TaxID=515560 RepID=A0ABT2FLZ0_9GAMM|nr:PepSY-associated TM helix domain-containing protein [Shewanella electrica]MCH1925772.1 PepSY domain-containing protein [Shewanella electrica]MCS4557343.1 PepSY domain-containing protein [Shewanella electrica]
MQIRSDILRIYQKVHLWTGITTGILLFICFFAGALTMFKTEIAAWASPPSHVLPQVPVERLDELLAKAQAQHPEISQGFTIYPNDSRYSPLTWSQVSRDHDVHLNAAQWQASLTPEGELITQQVVPNQLAELIDQLHRTAGIAGHVGHEQLGVLVMGVASMLYFIALVSGVIFLLPTLVKTLFALRRKKGPSRFWLDTHNLLGITALPFHIVIALTVIVFAFHDQFYDALNQTIYKTPPSFMPRTAMQAPAEHPPLPVISEVLTAANSFQADYQARSITFAGLDGPRAMARIEMYSDSAMMRGPLADFLALNPYNHQVMFSTMTAGEQGIWGRIVAVFFGLHFGSFAGMAGRWLYFGLGLSGAMLFYSGNLLWLEQRRKLQKQATTPVQQPKRVRIMAALTVGCCLGSVVAIAASMVLGKWLAPVLDNVNYSYLWIYYLGFAAALIYSFSAGAARAAIRLLQAGALLCLAIPLSSLAALCLPSLGLWAPQTPATLMVDVVALLSAAGFAYAAKVTYQRAVNGDADSIWALTPPTTPTRVNRQLSQSS